MVWAFGYFRASQVIQSAAKIENHYAKGIIETQESTSQGIINTQKSEKTKMWRLE